MSATGTLTLTNNAGAAGTIHLYIAGIYTPVSVSKDDTPTIMGDAVVAAVTENKNLPVTAANVTGVITFTSKTILAWGNFIDLSLNLGFEQELPDSVVAAIVAMSGGSGVPDIQDALDALGTDDDANELHFTDVIHGYGQETTVLDKLSAYNGEGNDFVGLYSKTVARPFRSLTGDTATGSSGLNALIILGDGRKTDRTNGVIAVPGSPNHPSEIAANAIGIMARINNDRAAESYVGKILSGILPGALADRWTSNYDSRDSAVKAGVSPTVIDGNAVLMQNALTFYHPDSVPVNSNGYRSQRNISITQNILQNIKTTFSQEKWQGISIVEDLAKVSNVVDRQKARDIGSVLDELQAITISFEGHSWLFTAAFTLERLATGDYVQIRSNSTGFDIVLPVIYSVEGGIIDTVVQFDTSIAVLLS
jgi:phage tail sheath gpL-like